MTTSQKNTIDLLENNPVEVGKALGFTDLPNCITLGLKTGYGATATAQHKRTVEVTRQQT